MLAEYRNDSRTIRDLVESDPRLAAAGVRVNCIIDGSDLVHVALAGPRGDRAHFMHEFVAVPPIGDVEQANLLVSRILRIEAAA